eukprot:9374597-Pyramimonas_sp.AAC.1
MESSKGISRVGAVARCFRFSATGRRRQEALSSGGRRRLEPKGRQGRGCRSGQWREGAKEAGRDTKGKRGHERHREGRSEASSMEI